MKTKLIVLSLLLASPAFAGFGHKFTPIVPSTPPATNFVDLDYIPPAYVPPTVVPVAPDAGPVPSYTSGSLGPIPTYTPDSSGPTLTIPETLDALYFLFMPFLP